MSSVLDKLFFNIKKGFHKKIKTPLKSTLSLAVTVMFSLKVSPSLPVRFKGSAAKKVLSSIGGCHSVEDYLSNDSIIPSIRPPIQFRGAGGDPSRVA